MQRSSLIVLFAVGASAHRCFHRGMQYNDFSGLNLTNLANQDFTTETAQGCQDECARVEACNYFTWWNNTKDCFLDTSDSTYTENQWAGVNITVDNMGYAGPTAGPKECPFEMPFWGGVLIGLGLLAVVVAAAVFILTKKKPAPKKKTRALPKPVPTVAEPVPTFTTIIYENQYGQMIAPPQSGFNIDPSLVR